MSNPASCRSLTRGRLPLVIELTQLKKTVMELKTRMKILSELQVDNIRITLGNKYGSASPDFYINGYCMYVQYSDNLFVGPCLTLGIKPGKYDDDLQWPLTGEITLILLHPANTEKHKELRYQIEGISTMWHFTSTYHVQKCTTKSCHA